MRPTLIKIEISNTKLLKIKKLQQPHFETPFHFHEMCELNYVLESNGKRIVGDNVSNFSSGDLVLMAANVPHIWYNDPASFSKINEEINAKAIVTYFSEDFFHLIIEDNPLILDIQNLLKKAKRGIHFKGETLQKVGPKLENAFFQGGLAKISSFLEVFDILLTSTEYNLLATASYSYSYSENDIDRLNQVYKYVINKFNEPITLSEVSAIAHMTPPAFCNFFKKRTQKSFTQFLNEIRIKHACKLLIEVDSTIAEVCYDCGYQTLTHFNKCFKYFMHKTPSEYKKGSKFLQN